MRSDGKKEWVLTEADIDCLAIGAGILGAGGGASPYLASIICKEVMRNGKECKIIAHDDMDNEEHTIIGAFLGAPLVAIEKVTTGNEVINAV